MKRSLTLSAPWVALAWAIVFAAPILGHWIGPDNGPTLPLVSLPWDPHRDLHSSVMTLFRAIAVGSLAALVVEPAKFRLRANGPLVYLLLVAYQGVLVVEVVRDNARDWWVWSLSAIGLVRLGSGNWRESHFPVPAPWASLIATILVLAVVAFYGRPRPDIKKP